MEGGRRQEAQACALLLVVRKESPCASPSFACFGTYFLICNGGATGLHLWGHIPSSLPQVPPQNHTPRGSC